MPISYFFNPQLLCCFSNFQNPQKSNYMFNSTPCFLFWFLTRGVFSEVMRFRKFGQIKKNSGVFWRYFPKLYYQWETRGMSRHAHTSSVSKCFISSRGWKTDFPLALPLITPPRNGSVTSSSISSSSSPSSSISSQSSS